MRPNLGAHQARRRWGLAKGIALAASLAIGSQFLPSCSMPTWGSSQAATPSPTPPAPSTAPATSKPLTPVAPGTSTPKPPNSADSLISTTSTPATTYTTSTLRSPSTQKIMRTQYDKEFVDIVTLDKDPNWQFQGSFFPFTPQNLLYRGKEVIKFTDRDLYDSNDVDENRVAQLVLWQNPDLQYFDIALDKVVEYTQNIGHMSYGDLYNEGLAHLIAGTNPNIKFRAARTRLVSAAQESRRDPLSPPSDQAIACGCSLLDTILLESDPDYFKKPFGKVKIPREFAVFSYVNGRVKEEDPKYTICDYK
ncbi:MAG: hypothetical protein ACE5FT_04625 [Candidatus Nanoarchaeia archaeon]